MGVADLVALGAIDLAGGFGFALDQPRVRRELLNGLEAPNVTDLVKNGERQDATNTGNAAKHTEGCWIVLFGLLFQMPFQLAQLQVITVDQSQIEIDVALHVLIGKGGVSLFPMAPVLQI